MSDKCEHCGIDEGEFARYIYAVEERVTNLEEELDKYTFVLKEISDYILNNKEIQNDNFYN